MTQIENLQLFEDQNIRMVWDDKEEKYYFSIVDIITVLVDSTDGRKYWNKLKQRLKEEGNETVTNCHQLKMTASDGKKRLTDVADQEQMFRLIQSIPSPKAEPVKLWIAQVASERLDEMQDPEIAIERALDYYRRKGYSEEWIKQRMKGKVVRKELTDEWKRTGVKDQQYATLTDIMTMAWAGMTTKQYKQHKDLRKENLRDHMTRTENALNTLAEIATTELSMKHNPSTFEENKKIARGGGHVAFTARQDLERQLGRSVISRDNAKHLNADDQDEIE